MWLEMQLSCMAQAWSSSSAGGHSLRHSAVGCVAELLHEEHARPPQQSSNPPCVEEEEDAEPRFVLRAKRGGGGRREDGPYVGEAAPVAVAEARHRVSPVQLGMERRETIRLTQQKERPHQHHRNAKPM
jgi:hypothetical protein